MFNLIFPWNLIFYLIFFLLNSFQEVCFQSVLMDALHHRVDNRCKVPEVEEGGDLGNYMQLSQRQPWDKVDQGNSTILKCAQVSKHPQRIGAFTFQLSCSTAFTQLQFMSITYVHMFSVIVSKKIVIWGLSPAQCTELNILISLLRTNACRKCMWLQYWRAVTKTCTLMNAHLWFIIRLID